MEKVLEDSFTNGDILEDIIADLFEKEREIFENGPDIYAQEADDMYRLSIQRRQ